MGQNGGRNLKNNNEPEKSQKKDKFVDQSKNRRVDELRGKRGIMGQSEIQEYLQNLKCKFTRAQSKLNVEVRSSVEVPQRRTNVHELERLAKESLDVKKMTSNSLSVRESREAANAAGCMKEQVGALLIGCVAGAGRMFPQPA